MTKRKGKIKNAYAKNLKGNEVYIGDVERGRKGYYCIGCGEKLEARKGERISPYFAHVPKDVSLGERKCTYSDESYRHKLAKEILQRIKQVKVPPLYKFPPSDEKGSAIKLDDSKTLIADHVRIELVFYENELGRVKYEKGVSYKEDKTKNFLIRPDVIFFNKAGKPYLFIEIVATHDINAEKLAKLKKLGIDTISIKIPKDSPEEIEGTFYKTQRTKWIFNHERESREYFSLSRGADKGVLQIDEFERKILEAEESFECRSSQLKNLIRGFRKNLDGERYKRVRGRTRQELSRVEGITERERLEYIELQEKAKGEVSDEFKERREDYRRELEKIRDEEIRIVQQEEDDKRIYRGLEERYIKKREELGGRKGFFRAGCQDEIERLKKGIQALGRTPTAIRDGRRILEEKQRREEEFFRTRIEEIRRRRENIRSEQERIRKERAALPRKYERVEATIKEGFRNKENELQEEQRKLEEGRGRDYEDYRRRISQAVKDRNGDGDPRIRSRIKEVLCKWELLLSVEKERSSLKRLKGIKGVLDKRAYKDWV